MKKFILDCTLRDGGYCNNWNFGKENIKKIISGISDANIDIIECGFLTNKQNYDENNSKFTEISQLNKFIGKNKKMYVLMSNYGEYNFDLLPHNQGVIDGIRLAFHKKDMFAALSDSKCIIEKGYKLFLQAMVTMNYSDEELLNLINLVNLIKPYAFYVVDSFGAMRKDNLIRFIYLLENNLDEKINIGYHAHNNLQMAYSNVETLLEMNLKHNLIIDSSIFGMGRGAGNLNTELIIDYFNNTGNKKYKLLPVLKIVDEVLNGFYERNYWGYSLANYISAIHNTHPNYASYLNKKKTLNLEDINNIIETIDNSKINNYDEQYIEKLYVNYLNKNVDVSLNLSKFKKAIEWKKILLIAPGKTVESEKETIIDFKKNNDCITISINFIYENLDTDYIFISNLRRFKEIDGDCWNRAILTSNIVTEHYFLKLQYKDLLNHTKYVKDNALLMLLYFLKSLNIKEVYLAGVDGYSPDYDDNYVDNKMNIYLDRIERLAINSGISENLKYLNNDMKLINVTSIKNIKW